MFISIYPRLSWQGTDHCRNYIKALKNSFHKLWDFCTIPVSVKLAGVVFLFVPFSLISCSDKRSPSHSELLKEYSTMRSDSRLTQTSSPSDLAEFVIRWKDKENQLFDLIREDSLAYEENYHTLTSMSFIGDSLSKKLGIIIDNRLYSYDELIEIQKKIATRYALIKTDSPYVAEANDFFSKIQPDLRSKGSVHDIESEYLDFLIDASSHTYHSWNDVKSSLREEDRLFRSYTSIVFEHSQVMASEIIEATHLFLERLSESLEAEDIDSDKLLAYMTVRTNSRLLVSAVAGLNAVELTYDMSEASFCVSSFMAPFLHFHPNIIATRTEHQNKILSNIGRKIPEAFETLDSQDFSLINSPDSLPNRILKDYFTYVLNN